MSDVAIETRSIRLAAIEAFCFRAPLKTPLRVAFGTFRDRPSVLVRVLDIDGTEGWGEAWSNFPTVGAEHRARLVAEVVGPRLLGRSFSSPQEAFRTLTSELEVLVLQTAEVGPIAQAIAGIDIALWDLAARKSGVPLYRLLGGAATHELPVYATGLSPDDPHIVAAQWYASGHRAFKLKTGFGADTDIKNIATLRKTLGDATLMIDSNQAHRLEDAIEMSRAAAPYSLAWFEEPLRIDAPIEDWRSLASASTIPLAGGENFRGEDFDRALDDRILTVFQPDVTKWGGFTGTLPVARKALAAGRRYCPHYFGGGLALLASLHLLAAVGGDGFLEFDAYDNVVREVVIGSLLPVSEGRVPVPQSPGLGAVPDLAALAPYRTWPL